MTSIKINGSAWAATSKRAKVRKNASAEKFVKKPDTKLLSWKFRGIVTFTQEGYGTEYMCLYTSDEFTGMQKECDEGKLEWIPKRKAGGDRRLCRTVEKKKTGK